MRYILHLQFSVCVAYIGAKWHHQHIKFKWYHLGSTHHQCCNSPTSILANSWSERWFWRHFNEHHMTPISLLSIVIFIVIWCQIGKHRLEQIECMFNLMLVFPGLLFFRVHLELCICVAFIVLLSFFYSCSVSPERGLHSWC